METFPDLRGAYRIDGHLCAIRIEPLRDPRQHGRRMAARVTEAVEGKLPRHLFNELELWLPNHNVDECLHKMYSLSRAGEDCDRIID